jgi:hypothetical protein
MTQSTWDLSLLGEKNAHLETKRSSRGDNRWGDDEAKRGGASSLVTRAERVEEGDLAE